MSFGAIGGGGGSGGGGGNGLVADAINDGTTTVAPSQNAVFDALALKITNPGGANDDFLQRKAGVYTNRTIAQVKTDLGVGSGSPVKSGGVGSDHWFNPPGCAGGPLSTALLSANSVFYIPWFTPVDIVITAVAAIVNHALRVKLFAP
jgi:hypothetical protein